MTIVTDAIVVCDGDAWAAAIPHANGWSVVDTYNPPVRFPHDMLPGSVRGIRAAIEFCTVFVDDDRNTEQWRDVYSDLRTELRKRYGMIRPYDWGRP